MIVQILNPNVHDRESFQNIDSDIERFLKERANQEHRKYISDTYVVVDPNKICIILGYFTLSNSALILNDIPSSLQKMIPGYPKIGTVLLGRIGRNTNHTEKGFGTIVLKYALEKSLERGSFFALELNAKNSKLVDYYKSYGFIPTGEDPQHMILPYASIKSALKSK
ncbi:MAG: hypothetical protein U1E78_12870 [Gammaproteobacteria bacterium]